MKNLFSKIVKSSKADINGYYCLECAMSCSSACVGCDATCWGKCYGCTSCTSAAGH